MLPRVGEIYQLLIHYSAEAKNLTWRRGHWTELSHSPVDWAWFLHSDTESQFCGTCRKDTNICLKEDDGTNTSAECGSGSANTWFWFPWQRSARTAQSPHPGAAGQCRRQRERPEEPSGRLQLAACSCRPNTGEDGCPPSAASHTGPGQCHWTKQQFQFNKQSL